MWPDWARTLYISPGLCFGKGKWRRGSADTPGEGLERESMQQQIKVVIVKYVVSYLYIILLRS